MFITYVDELISLEIFDFSCDNNGIREVIITVLGHDYDNNGIREVIMTTVYIMSHDYSSCTLYFSKVTHLHKLMPLFSRCMDSSVITRTLVIIF